MNESSKGFFLGTKDICSIFATKYLEFKIM